MLAQQLINGSVVGATYSLFALGFALMFGVLGVVNLTYGFYFTAGAFIALYLMNVVGCSIGTAIPLAVLLTGLLAIAFDTALLTGLRNSKAPELSSLMVTLGATLLLYSLATAWLGTEIMRMPSGMLGTAFGTENARITASQILILATSFLTVSALFILLHWTRLGVSIRALAENADAAKLMGINTSLIFGFVSFVSGALGATAGVLVGLNYNGVQPYMGETMMLKGFAVIILGGLGDVRGAILGGLIVGLLETLVSGYGASTLKDAVAFTLLVVVLWVRPGGLFGVAAAKRV